MTATGYTTPAMPYDRQDQPRRTHKVRYALIGAAAALGLLAGAGAAAAALTHSPPTATSVLAQDGYTPLSQATLNDMGASMPASLSPYVSSYAAGTRPGSLEVVAILTPAGESKISQGGMASLGSNASLHGDVLRVDESTTASGGSF